MNIKFVLNMFSLFIVLLAMSIILTTLTLYVLNISGDLRKEIFVVCFIIGTELSAIVTPTMFLILLKIMHIWRK